MDNIVLGLNQVAASVSLLVASLLGHTPPATTHHPQQAAAVEQPPTGPTYHIDKSISYQGYTVSMSADVPENGGDITGAISGSCNGPITGHYDGGDNGAITGNANITCKIGFFQIPGTVTFNGTVNKVEKHAQLLLDLSAGSITKSENIVVNFK